MSRVAAISGVLALLVAGCTPAPTGLSTSEVRPSQTASSRPAAQPRLIVGDLEVPWDFAVLPDSRVMITLRDRAELIRVVPGGKPQLVAKVPDVVPNGEGGLLGLALSPGFAKDQLIYLYLTAANDNRVVRYRYADSGLSEPTPIVTGIPKAANHDGGRLRFGPDGLLYIGTGDAGNGKAAQDRESMAGKILRVSGDGSIPPDNPFGNAVYSYGHRNVQGLGWDRTGQLYASEFGQNLFDELNLIRPGSNYGWPITEGKTDAAGMTSPALVWRTSEASPSGIAVSPEGTVYLAALRGERVWLSRRTDTGMAEPQTFLDGHGRIRAVGIVADELYVLTNNTARGTPRAHDDQLLAVPLA